MADGKTYPVGYYKVGEAVQYAHTPKDEQRLQEAGFSEGAGSIPKQEYPKLVYDKDGNTQKAQHAQHEVELKKAGYGTKPVPPKAAPSVRSSSRNSGESNGRLDALEEDVAGLKDSMAEVLDLLKSKK